MAVSLPSDLVLDVIRNADPARREAAVAKLRSAGESDGRAVAFAGVVDGLAPSHPPHPATPTPSSEGPGRGREAYEGFERMVLRNLFEAMLPGEESGAYGEGPGAGVWRSMAADQFAGAYVASGGLGIAASLADEGSGASPVHHGQWPYFSVGKIAAFTG